MLSMVECKADCPIVVFLQLASRSTDANLGMCPSSHPVMDASALEDESKRLLEDCIKLLYMSRCAQSCLKTR